ncbi:GATA zinc finger domain-containing protein 4-like [Gordionus sp. m RMFG-2023]|uniref:GATA zinc finger domain-containing protein 4-like n=1 Tax=Gordionus sp. m RMFG-2023 TaxID=3053472 RepID=UPI0031FD0B40
MLTTTGIGILVTYRYNNSNRNFHNNNHQSYNNNYGRNNAWFNYNQRRQIQCDDQNHNNYRSYNNNSSYEGNNRWHNNNNQRKQIEYDDRNRKDFNQRKQIEYDDRNRCKDFNQRKQIQYDNQNFCDSNNCNMNIEEIGENKVDIAKDNNENDFNVNNLAENTDKGNVDTNYKDEINKLIKGCESKLTSEPINKINVKLHLRCDAQPKIIPPRRIPYSKIDLVGEELKRWIHEKIIEPVNDVRWASLITAIYKDDGSIRLCADIKDTINPALEDFRCSLPRINDFIVKLSEGKKFTKIDFKNASTSSD